MAQNFIACDREQVPLLPSSVRDWLPDDHVALFVIDAVAQLDLEAFYGHIVAMVTAVRRTSRR